MTDDLRPYGPGKFNLMADAAVYSASLDGCAETEECGDSSATRVDAPLYNVDDLASGAIDLTDAERAFLDTQAGAILWENSQGFVDVTYYATKRELDTAWEKLCVEIAAESAAYDDESEDR